MKKKIVVVDDDLLLVEELRRNLDELKRAIPKDESYTDLELVAPPELLLDRRGVLEKIRGASVVVLDLNIGGSASGGKALLTNRSIRKELNRSSTPLVIWSKYIGQTLLLEPSGILQTVLFDPDEVSKAKRGGTPELKFSEINGLDYSTSPEYLMIREIRKIHPPVRAFVSKRLVTPAKLFQVIKRVLAAADGMNMESGKLDESSAASRE